MTLAPPNPPRHFPRAVRWLQTATLPPGPPGAGTGLGEVVPKASEPSSPWESEGRLGGTPIVLVHPSHAHTTPHAG